MIALSVNVFRAYQKHMRMVDIARAEAKAGRVLSNDLRRAGMSVRRRTPNTPNAA